ncbi:oxidoreductase [Enterobacter cloacae]|uniref:oxidoreductase n=1 Tax=Enterobacter cloacae TaxID=550 RepID=UPI000666EEC9|nr:oxidoreductase [Enterobacter cloacae]SSH46441.1 2-deoxy-D-gluconate 3-dehydrogenase [Klebsiella pneumoniae]HAS1007494.1 SDR family oxidoreductase [Enterobacter cloacae]HAS1147609.1 SDR family oxidoreductase [Enterobacter cloacae]HAS1181014.1 SDR family oxidoreductase [Enterobacter cloacae]HAS1199408.1 SDR family oxidoreductase [Enterobacter cloacae]
MLLKNKEIIVFGAGGLLGACLTKACIENGAKVIAVDLNVNHIKTKLQAQGIVTSSDIDLTYAEVDVTNEQSVMDFFNSLVNIDGIVNATYPRNKTYGSKLFDVTVSSFNENLSLHLGSSFLISQQAAKLFLRLKSPLSMVNISSIYGVIAPKFNIYNNTQMTMPVEYAAIKSALLHLNKYIVAYINNSDFRINSVSPGGIYDNQPASFCEAYRKNTHGAGMLDVSEMTGAILFLLSEQSRYVTGQNIIVDDGFSL